MVAELTVSKEDNKPVIQVLIIMIAAQLAVNSRAWQICDQNTGVRAEEPKGIDKVKGY